MVNCVCKKLTRGHQSLTKKRTVLFLLLCVCTHTHAHTHTEESLVRDTYQPTCLINKRQIARPGSEISCLIYTHISLANLCFCCHVQHFITSNFSCIFNSTVKYWKGIGPSMECIRFPQQSWKGKHVLSSVTLQSQISFNLEKRVLKTLK